MSNFGDELKTLVDGHMSGTYETYRPIGVPEPEDVPLGKKAALLTATALFIDVRQSSDITNALRRQTAAKMMKAYFDGAVRIIRRNNGEVRSFNGDGMLALFIGDTRSSNGVKAAMQVRWFVSQVLRPEFKRYFATNTAAVGRALEFSIGCGLDDGDIYAVRVGIRGTNDVAWVGRCTNTAAKLASFKQPNRVRATQAVYKQLVEDRKTTDGKSMWSNEISEEIGGVARVYRYTTWHWAA